MIQRDPRQPEFKPVQQNTTQAPTADKATLDAILDRQVDVEVFHTNRVIQLSARLVMKYLCKPTKSKKLCSAEQAVRFCMLCQAQGLDPWVGDAYIVGYDAQDGPEFNLITAHQAFLKRAEAHPEYNGLQAGVIVGRGDQLIEDEGDFFFDSDKLLGGWAKVYFKTREIPILKRIRLDAFDKGFSRWKVDPGGMIVKCAEADALRSAFPNVLGGLYLEQELGETTGDAPDVPEITMPQRRSEQTADERAVEAATN